MMTQFRGQNIFGAQIVADQLTNITNTEQTFEKDGVTLILNGNEDDLWHIQAAGDFVSTPTDDLVFSFYATTDDSSEEWDLTPFYQLQLSRLTDPNRRSVTLSGFYRCKITVKASGSTDTHTSADLKIRGRSYK